MRVELMPSSLPGKNPKDRKEADEGGLVKARAMPMSMFEVVEFVVEAWMRDELRWLPSEAVEPYP